MLRFFVMMIVFFQIGFLQADLSRVSINFQDVDIRLLIKFIGDISEKNVVVDDAVTGTVTVVSKKELEKKDALELLFSVLNMHGYVYDEHEKSIRVMPKEKAQSQGKETFIGKSLDKVSPGKYITQIIPLDYAKVEEVKDLILPLLGKGSNISFYPKRNALIISEEASHLKSILSILQFLDVPHQERETVVKVYKLNFTQAEHLAKILEKLFNSSKERGMQTNKKENVKFVPDPLSNSIVVSAKPLMHKKIIQVMKSLDKKRKQVLVEVLIAEVDIDKSFEWGIDWLTAEGFVYGTPLGFGQNVKQTKQVIDHVLTGGSNRGVSSSFVHDTKQIGNIEFPRLGAIITAFKEDKDINVLSTPQLLALDHEEAEILVGENRAFIQNTQVTAEGGTVRTFEFKDVGLLLRIKPHVMEDDYIELEIYQRTEDVIGQSFEGAVETSKREAKTKVIIKDKAIAILGGLIRKQNNDKVKKVPLLGNIPLIGLMFRNVVKEEKRVNLLIFISPHIIYDESDLQYITQQKTKKAGLQLENSIVK